jgi:hypothetical protein
MGQTPFANRDSSAAPPRAYAFRRAPLSRRPTRGRVAGGCLGGKETSRALGAMPPAAAPAPAPGRSPRSSASSHGHPPVFCYTADDLSFATG